MAQRPQELRDYRVWQYDVLEQNGLLGLVVGTPHQPEDPYAAPEDNPDPLAPDEIIIRVLGVSVPYKIKADELPVVDRGFTYSDPVTWAETAPRAWNGIVQSGIIRRVRIMLDVTFSEPLLSHFAVADRNVSRLNVLTDVDSQHFLPATPMMLESLVTYRGWVGSIEGMVYELILQTSTHTFCIPVQEVAHVTNVLSAFAESSSHFVGATVLVPPRVWRSARVLTGSQSTVTYPEHAVIAAFGLRFLEIQWITPDVEQERPMPPPRINVSKMTEAQTRRLFDYPSHIFENDGFNIGSPLIVRPDSPHAAVVKEHFDRLRRQFPVPLTMGLIVTRTRSVVDVQWQDGSISRDVKATDLVFRNNIDEHEFFSGDFVVEKKVQSLADGESAVDDVERVGVVLSMNAAERTCKVRWMDAYVRDNVQEEEVPVFNLQRHSLWDFQIGSEVVLLSKAAHSTDAAVIARAGAMVDDFVRGTEREGRVKPIDDQARRAQYAGVALGVMPEGLVVVLWANASFSAVPPDHLLLVEDEGEEEADPDAEDEEEESDEWIVEDDVEYSTNDNQEEGDEGDWETDEEEDDDENVDDEDEHESSSGNASDVEWYTDDEIDDAEIEADAMDVDEIDDDVIDVSEALTESEAMEMVLNALSDSSVAARQLILDTIAAQQAQTSSSEGEEDTFHDARQSPEPEERPTSGATAVEASAETAQGGAVLFEMLESAPANHHFISSATQPSRQLMHRLAQEHSMLESSLPSGILVRVFEDRMDLMQCMICGPADTPYEDIMFLFDLHMPPTYPQVPPEVFFYSWTDSLGRLNPNLYEDGKVCLSILGTWTGNGVENWSPASNVLRVLLSIQAMVLVREPYYNEAGFERFVGSVEGDRNSQMYTENIFLISLRSVMQAMRHPPPSFAASVYDHYITNGALDRILARCDALVSDDAQGTKGARHVPAKLTKGARSVLADLVKQMRHIQASATRPVLQQQ